MADFDLAVIGGGIVGLSVGMTLGRRYPDASVLVLEKEDKLAAHQTGRNSGVIHSGLYYPPGSAKARLCRAGATSMVEFARAEGIPHEVCGKLVVVTRADELPRLRQLAARGRENGLTVTELDAAGAREHEPHVDALAAVHVAETGVVDYGRVCAALVHRLEAYGATLLLGAEVLGTSTPAAPAPGTTGMGARGGVTVRTTRGDLRADLVVACAGLHADVVARRLGHEPDTRVVPFRGEYRVLAPSAAHLVRGLVYPVPDPELPVLGVHLTRGIDGEVHAGPNAVLALAREGYSWGTASWPDLLDTLAFPGSWRLAARHLRTGAHEVARSVSAHRFADSLRRLVPELRDEDLLPAPAGVRAQAVRRDGSLVDDFLVERSGRVVHVLNAPSPAATSAFEIARHIVDDLLHEG